MSTDDLHMLAVNNIFFDRDQAVMLAKRFNVDVTPIVTDISFVFIVHPTSEFEHASLRTSPSKGFYFIRGKRLEETNGISRHVSPC